VIFQIGTNTRRWSRRKAVEFRTGRGYDGGLLPPCEMITALAVETLLVSVLAWMSIQASVTLAALVTVGIVLVVLWAWFVVEVRFSALCWVSLLAIVWVWIAEQYRDQSALLLRSAYHHDISQSQPQSLRQSKLEQENLAESNRVYSFDQVLVVSTPCAEQQHEREFHGFEDEDLNGEPHKNRNACAIVCEISDQEPLGWFYPKPTRIPSSIRPPHAQFGITPDIGLDYHTQPDPTPTNFI